VGGGVVVHRRQPAVAAAHAGAGRRRAVRLLPAPDTYRDFQSPSLVVPSDMPRAEMSLPGAMIVQALHVLQDLYPVVSSHQPEAAADPAERVAQAYPWLFRLVRTPPAWHPELAGAQRHGRLLDVLASAAPSPSCSSAPARGNTRSISTTCASIRFATACSASAAASVMRTRPPPSRSAASRWTATS
jgi:hypothetical protein